MRRALFLVLLAFLPSGPLLAQNGDAAVQSIAPLHEMVKGYIIASAEQMPESRYNYRPTEDVRSFGQIIGHVANSLYYFCGVVAGDQAEPPEDFEQRTTKAGLVEAIKMGFSACDAAYAIDDATAMTEVDFFGNTGTRLWVLTFNLTHNWEHYGNLVTYLRANGQVPPSSQGGM